MTLLSLRYGYQRLLHLSQVTRADELSLLSFFMCLTDQAAADHKGLIRLGPGQRKSCVALGGDLLRSLQKVQEGKRASATTTTIMVWGLAIISRGD